MNYINKSQDKSSTSRTQINFRIDEDFLQEIKDAARVQGISHTEFILNACKQALGYEVTQPINPTLSLQTAFDRLNKIEVSLKEYCKRLNNLESESNINKQD